MKALSTLGTFAVAVFTDLTDVSSLTKPTNLVVNVTPYAMLDVENSGIDFTQFLLIRSFTMTGDMLTL